jgi:hypothetical protein
MKNEVKISFVICLFSFFKNTFVYSVCFVVEFFIFFYLIFLFFISRLYQDETTLLFFLLVIPAGLYETRPIFNPWQAEVVIRRMMIKNGHILSSRYYFVYRRHHNLKRLISVGKDFYIKYITLHQDQRSCLNRILKIRSCGVFRHNCKQSGL